MLIKGDNLVVWDIKTSPAMCAIFTPLCSFSYLNFYFIIPMLFSLISG